LRWWRRVSIRASALSSITTLPRKAPSIRGNRCAFFLAALRFAPFFLAFFRRFFLPPPAGGPTTISFLLTDGDLCARG
jgi:hypothetical protein